MKNLMTLILTVVLTIPALAVGPAPKELQGGVITVKLKDGKTYTFSSDEYAVVKRGTESKAVSASNAEEIAATNLELGKKIGEQKAKDEQHKNILSVGVVRSKNGFDTEMTASTVDVKSRKDLGLSGQYQRRFNENKYLGIRGDTNGGIEINGGVGF